MKGLYCRAAVSDTESKFVIQETTLPDVIGSHQVRIRVKACGLSPLDLKLLRDVGIQKDLIPVGRVVAGVVLQVDPSVTFFQPEDEVVGILPLDSSCSGLCEIIDIDEYLLGQQEEQIKGTAAYRPSFLCLYGFTASVKHCWQSDSNVKAVRVESSSCFLPFTHTR
uniref:Crystallin, zeta (Quinone reductase)-like 1 n=1 Tax=Nothobranchius rachovii TaxID=451742 RepID=A0A1A8R4K3_9TELE